MHAPTCAGTSQLMCHVTHCPPRQPLQAVPVSCYRDGLASVHGIAITGQNAAGPNAVHSVTGPLLTCHAPIWRQGAACLVNSDWSKPPHSSCVCAPSPPQPNPPLRQQQHPSPIRTASAPTTAPSSHKPPPSCQHSSANDEPHYLPQHTLLLFLLSLRPIPGLLLLHLCNLLV